MMKLYIDGEEVAGQIVTGRSLGYGQPVPGKRQHIGLVCLTRTELAACCEGLYEAFAQETKLEEERGLEADPSSLRDAGYPSWGELVLRHPKLLEELIVEYLAIDVLDRLLGANALLPGCKYVINRLTGLHVRDSGEEIELIAEAFVVAV